MAITFNIESQVVVQDALTWSSDATVYSELRILVTSDEYYGATDQRKLKISNGVDVWADLDYLPLSGAGTLASVLLSGNTTGEQRIKSNDSKSYLDLINGFVTLCYNEFGVANGQLYIDPTTLLLTWTNASGDGGTLTIDPTLFKISHSDLIILDAPDLRVANTNVTYNANEDILAFYVVTSNGLIADSNNTAHKNKIIGINKADILTGFVGNVTASGEMINALWTWVVGDKIYLNGTSLSTTAASTGFSVQIGTATKTDTIDIKIQISILL